MYAQNVTKEELVIFRTLPEEELLKKKTSINRYRARIFMFTCAVLGLQFGRQESIFSRKALRKTN